MVHVVDPAVYNGLELYVRPISEVSEEHLDIARETLDSFLAADFSVAECPRILTSGDAATEIARVPKDGGISHIIMPTHAGIFRKMLLGSTTVKVLNDADCPVLTSRHAETIAPRPLEHREWLCAIGLRVNSEKMVRIASQAATQARSKLSNIHAVQSGDLGRPTRLDLREQVDIVAERDASLRLADLQKAVGTEVPLRIAAGPVKEALLVAAPESDADVLMIGRSLRSSAHRRMRDLTYGMARDSPFPVPSV
jgi:nucleotide-binding universal stress UspA family protein